MPHLRESTKQFLIDLKAHNERPWFDANRPRYEEARADFISLIGILLHEIEKFDPGIAGQEAKKSVFRIYRDTRFSKNKTPYKTNFGAHILYGGGGNLHRRAGYFMNIEPGNCFLAGGAFRPSAGWIGAIRQRIDGDADTLRKIIARKKFRDYFDGIEGESLKTAPRGYPKDHPDIELLRQKSFLARHRLPDAQVFSPGFLKHAASVYRALKPFDDFLNAAINPRA
jgi:uncharacterized protein (TIGR02453 family)